MEEGKGAVLLTLEAGKNELGECHLVRLKSCNFVVSGLLASPRAAPLSTQLSAHTAGRSKHKWQQSLHRLHTAAQCNSHLSQ